eukprot:s2186_g8.t1
MLWALLCLQPFLSWCEASEEGCVSESCGLPPGQPAEASDAFASIQVGKQTTENEVDDQPISHSYTLTPEGTLIIKFQYANGIEEVYDTLDPNAPGLLQEQGSQERGLPWKIWKIKKIKEALERRRHPRPCPPGDFFFSFPNDPRNDPAQGLVTGCISGLSCNTELAAATSVRVLTNEAGFGLGEYVPGPIATFNFWNVTSDCEVVPFTLFGSFGDTTLALTFDDPSSSPFGCGGLSALDNATFTIRVACSDQVKFEYIS